MTLNITAEDIGKQVRLRDGKVARITQVDPSLVYYKTEDKKAWTCDSSGSWTYGKRPDPRDIVEIIEEAPSEDEVNHPSHYTQGSVECIEAIRAALTPEEFRGYCKGNILKYIWRERNKQQDIAVEKARWYINTLLEG